MLKLNTKAAMFGLDARIALAIFGALSVISGAALYGAIQEAKSQRYISLFTEVGKALEAYYLDTGAVPGVDLNTASVLDITVLVEDPGVKGWEGPYIDLEINHPNDGVNPSALSYDWGNKQAGGSVDNIRLRRFPAGDLFYYKIQVQGIDEVHARALSEVFNGEAPDDLLTGTDFDSVMQFNGGYQGYLRIMTLDF